MLNENFEAVLPKNEIIRKSIAYYYFYKVTDANFSNQFDYFPHYRKGITVFKDSSVHWDAKTRYTMPANGVTSVIFTQNIKSKKVAMDRGELVQIELHNDFIEVGFYNQKGELELTKTLRISEIRNRVGFDLNFMPSKIVLDPNLLLTDKDLVDNEKVF